MNVEQLLQLSLSTLSVLSAILLGIGQQSPHQPFMMLVAAVTSVVFTDRLGWLRLNRFFANAAMIAAAVLTLNDFLGRDSESQLQAIGGLLTWVQIVLFYQAKNLRVYGSLAVFSLLQVVVAALLSVGLEFGILLTIYLISAAVFLTAYCAHRDISRIAAEDADTNQHQPAESDSAAGAAWRKLLSASPQVFDRLDDQAVNGLFDTRRLTIYALATCLPSLCFAGVFFYCTPRSSGGVWQRIRSARSGMVGFSQRISLDQMTDVLQNDDPALRMALYDPATRKPMEVLGGPYIQGVTLSEYSANERPGTWTPPRAVGPGARLTTPPQTSELVFQDVVLEPSREPVLFSLWPMYDVEETPGGIRIEQNTRRLFRFQDDEPFGRPRQFRYVLATTSVRHGDQMPISPLLPEIDTAFRQFERTLEFNGQKLSGLKTLATKVLADQQIPLGDPYRVARTLENYLRTSPEFTYALKMRDVHRQPGVDPIEDFVLNHRTGHCSYFASALALMLRSQGVPSRLVVGFKATEYNPVGGYYLVRQRDAHAWVESYLKPEHVVVEDLPAGESAPLGGWLRLDPTPSSRGDGRQFIERGVIDRLDDVLDYAQLLWTEHVLGLNRDRQARMLYRPLTDQAGNAADLWKNPSRARLMLTIRRWLGLSSDPDQPTQIPWRTFAVVAAVGGCLWFLIRVGRRRGIRIWKSRGKNFEKLAKANVDFYNRWEAILKQRGIRRHVRQTQREFAALVDSKLNTINEQLQTRHLAQQIVNAFYRVRFGGATLDKAEYESIEQELTSFEAALKRSN